MVKTHRVMGTLAVAAAVSAALQAQQAPEEVIVLGRWDNPFGYSISASQGVVGAAEIDARPRLRTGEILEVVPGLIVTQHSGTGKSNQMFLRGFNLDHGTDFATWVDGMPVNLPTHGHGQGYTDLNFLIPELVERLEYRKGAYYAEVVGLLVGRRRVPVDLRAPAPKACVKAGLGEDGYVERARRRQLRRRRRQPDCTACRRIATTARGSTSTRTSSATTCCCATASRRPTTARGTSRSWATTRSGTRPIRFRGAPSKAA